MDLWLRVAGQGDDGLAHWLLVELLSPAGELLDADRFRWAKAIKRVLLNADDLEALPPDMRDMAARYGPPREANIFDYRKLMDVAARHFLRRQELVGWTEGWTPADWRLRTGDETLPPSLSARRAALLGAELLINAAGVSGKLRPRSPASGTVTTISTELDRWFDAGVGCGTTGNLTVGSYGSVMRHCHRFPLATFPSGGVISAADFKPNVIGVTGAPVADVQAYNQNGQADMGADSCANFETRCADDASPYMDNITTYQTTGVKTITLPSAAYTDIEAAKSAVNRFSLAVNENGTAATNYASIENLDAAGTDEALLVLTHTSPIFVPRVIII